MDMGSITAAIGGLQAATDIAKSMVGVRDTAIIQSKTIELQSAILAAQSSAITAQSEQFTLLERVRDLEKEVAGVEAWGAEKQRYTLHEPQPGIFTYILKEEEGATEPNHQICANCCDIHKRKSIMQMETRNPGMAEVLCCHNCGSHIYVFGHWHRDHGRPGQSKSMR